MTNWPKDNQDALLAFYGTPGADVERQLVKVTPPFPMSYGDQRIGAIKFHEKAAPALIAALDKIWSYYGKVDAAIEKLNISHYDGAYNPRFIRGSTSKWSNHAYGAAIDIDAAHNGFNTGHGHMPLPVVAAFKSEGFRWGGDYHGRTDPMHFEGCDSGEPARTFEEWLAYYHCPPSYQPDDHPAVPIETPAPSVQARPIIRLGATGELVTELQTALAAKGLAVKADGDFGPATFAALKKYQASAGIPSDGICGPATWAALGN